jgi:hypothetical protein
MALLTTTVFEINNSDFARAVSRHVGFSAQVKQIEARWLSEEVKAFVGPSLTIASALTSQRVSYTWRF